jgi:protein TonB
MEPKKSEKADLEKKKGIFLEIGFIIALGIVLLAFEWKTRPRQIGGFQSDLISDVIQENVPVTRQERRNLPPPPPPPDVTEELKIVDNDVIIEDELILEETEADEDTRVSITAFGNVDEDEDEEEKPIFMVVEDMPTFRGGGVEDFRRYVQENIKYPTLAAENGIEGTVYVKFVVDTDGGISNVLVVRGVDPALDDEAVRVIENAPEWEPGRQRGIPVRVQFTIPIVFKLL